MSDPHDFAAPALADEDSTARLLRLAGPRSGVPVDRAARMRQAVYNEWRSEIGGRRHVRRALGATATLAAVAMVAVAPVLSIEGKSVASVLESLSREHGWTLSYADAALGREADQIILHGSIDGLTPEQALDVALQTSGLAYRLRDGNLVVFRVGS